MKILSELACTWQVDACGKDLSKEKEYYQRYRICEEHLRLSTLSVDGRQQRFCQQCGRFHPLADFDDDKRYTSHSVTLCNLFSWSCLQQASINCEASYGPCEPAVVPGWPSGADTVALACAELFTVHDKDVVTAMS